MKIKFFFKHIVIILSIIALSIGVAIARPGGGHSGHHSGGYHGGGYHGGGYHGGGYHGGGYHGGGHSGYHGGGYSYSGDSTVSSWILFLIVGVVILGGMILEHKNKGSYSKERTISIKGFNSIDQKLSNAIKQYDPNFSIVIFKDFVTLLFMRYLDSQGKNGDFSQIKPFFTDQAFNLADINNKAKYTEIAINNITIVSFNDNKELQENIITVKIKADYTCTYQKKSQRKTSELCWTFVRSKNAITVEPQDTERICCPFCGAPANITDAGTCAHCGNEIKLNKLKWTVKEAQCISKLLKLESQFTYSDDDDETMYVSIEKSSNADQKVLKMAKKANVSPKIFIEDFYKDVARPLITTLYNCWANNELYKCRHLLSDRQYESMKIWTDYLAKNNVYNKLTNVKILQTRLIDANIDKFYDSITLEITISCADYMINKKGKIVAGNTNAHPFKELFTFVRGTLVKTNNISIHTCPSCGAPADKMGESAICEYCGTKISTGKFSWVLSSIEQVC